MRALLLNSTYQPISFISERKVVKMVVKEKVEILSIGAVVRYVLLLLLN